MTSIQIKLSNKTQSPYRGLRCPTQSGPWVASNITFPVSHLPLIPPCKGWPSRWPLHTTLALAHHADTSSGPLHLPPLPSGMLVLRSHHDVSTDRASLAII